MSLVNVNVNSICMLNTIETPMFELSGRNACEKTSFTFLKKEIPVRLANIMKEITLLPENLQQMPSVTMVQNWYIQSFKEMLEFQNKSPEDDAMLKK